MDSTLPCHYLFEFLPSGWRHKAFYAHTSRLRNSFFSPQSYNCSESVDQVPSHNLYDCPRNCLAQMTSQTQGSTLIHSVWIWCSISVSPTQWQLMYLIYSVYKDKYGTFTHKTLCLHSHPVGFVPAHLRHLHHLLSPSTVYIVHGVHPVFTVCYFIDALLLFWTPLLPLLHCISMLLHKLHDYYLLPFYLIWFFLNFAFFFVTEYGSCKLCKSSCTCTMTTRASAMQ